MYLLVIFGKDYLFNNFLDGVGLCYSYAAQFDLKLRF